MNQNISAGIGLIVIFMIAIAGSIFLWNMKKTDQVAAQRQEKYEKLLEMEVGRGDELEKTYNKVSK